MAATSGIVTHPIPDMDTRVVVRVYIRVWDSYRLRLLLLNFNPSKNRHTR